MLLSAAEDKTARVWDPRTLTCLRVLRPPLGEGDRGKLYAAALTPDGRTAVLAGFTRAVEGGGHHVFIMDVQDGHLIRQISGLPQVVNRLSLSPDGRILVVHLGEKLGLRVYRLADGTELARDPLFNGPTFQGAFAPDGRYAASADDGYVRMYDPQFKLLAKARTPGRNPFGLAFSPDGSKLLLGYADGCRVELLSTKTLFPVARLDTAGAEGPLAVVAWSRDGSRLYACGGQDFGARPNPVYLWPEGGRGPRREAGLAWATYSDLLPLAGGGLLAAAQDPSLSRLDADLKVVARMAASPGALGQARELLKVDASGRQVALGWRHPDRPALVFALDTPGLQDAHGSLVGPLLETQSLKLQDWLDGEHPTLNGAALGGLEPFERVHALSLDRGAQGFALGTDWSLRLYDAQGRLQHATPLAAACWALNHTPDGRWLLAALADGTVRWYRAQDGKEAMALFLSPEAGRWVMWTPQGFYATSVGGEELLGWQVQREGEAGAFFPLSHFRATCQPGLFGDLLKAGELAATPPLQTPPPSIRILEPAPGAPVQPGRTHLRVEAQGAGEPGRTWQVYLDGRKLPAPPPQAPQFREQGPFGMRAEYDLELPLPDQGGQLALVLVSGAGASEPARLTLAAAPQAAAEGAPALNVLTIGVSGYRQPGLELAFPAKDARDVAALFQDQKAKLYSEVRSRTLVDGEATREGILAALRALPGQAGPRDVTVLFLSGHGQTGAGQYFFLPSDADPAREATMVDGREFQDTLGRVPGKVVLLLDTCHSGSLLGEGRMRGLEAAAPITRFINELASAENGVMVFSSATGRQFSMEAREWGNGAFTKALREGLSGRADPGGSGRVTLAMLDTYLRDRVRELTKGSQTPVTGRPALEVDFPLVVTR